MNKKINCFQTLLIAMPRHLIFRALKVMLFLSIGAEHVVSARDAPRSGATRYTNRDADRVDLRLGRPSNSG